MENANDSQLRMLLAGDVAPVRQPVDRLADLIKPDIADRDFLIAQCERVYSERGAFQDWVTVPRGTWSRLTEDYASVWKAAGINVASVASNHALDYGIDPFLDTIDLFRSWGMTVMGGGRSQDEARRPALLKKGTATVAVLAYNCVLRDGQKAFRDHPGLSAVRCRTWYEVIDHQPGTPPLVMSAPREDDLADMVADIENARKLAGSVVVYIHWGLRYVPKVISTYQPIIGHAAIDAGADIVVGHGPHVVKGIEVYKDRAIFYSIGNFLTTGRTKHNEPGTQEWNVVWMEHPHDPAVQYGFPEHAKRAMIPRLTFDSDGLAKIEVLPTLINDLAQPRVLKAGDPEFESHFEYVKWASDTLENDLRVDGDVYVVGKARD
jgi:hypothetical protein